MKTAEKRRSSSGPSTSHKKRKSELAEAWNLEAVENEDVVTEEVLQLPLDLNDEIKIEQPELQEQVVEIESSESIEKKRMEMEIDLLTSEITLLKKEKMELKTENRKLKTDITLQRMDNADDVQKLQNDALDLRDKLFKQQNEIMELKLNESKLNEKLKIKAEKVDELALQLKTEMLNYKTEMETLGNQHKATSIENGKLKDTIENFIEKYSTINTKQ